MIPPRSVACVGGGNRGRLRRVENLQGTRMPVRDKQSASRLHIGGQALETWTWGCESRVFSGPEAHVGGRSWSVAISDLAHGEQPLPNRWSDVEMSKPRFERLHAPSRLVMPTNGRLKGSAKKGSRWLESGRGSVSVSVLQYHSRIEDWEEPINVARVPRNKCVSYSV